MKHSIVCATLILLCACGQAPASKVASEPAPTSSEQKAPKPPCDRKLPLDKQPPCSMTADPHAAAGVSNN